MKDTKIELRKKVVIIGGGITGLSAARYLDTHANGLYSVTLIEARGTLGGQIVTRKVSLETGERLVLDGGVDYFETGDPEVKMLAEELGLERSIRYANPPTLYVLDGGQMVRLPQSVMDFVRSKLLTWREKQRAFKDLFIPPTQEDDDETVAAFVTRRLGKPTLEKIVGPILDGMYGSNLGTQSVLTRFPELREIERDFGGLVRGAVRRKLAGKKASSQLPQKAPYFRFADGAQTIVDSLANSLGVEVRVNTRAVEVNKQGGRYQVVLSAGDPIEADAVIMATPANVSAKVLDPVAPESSTLLFQIPHETTGCVSLLYRSQDLPGRFEFDRLVIPRREGRVILSVSRVPGEALQGVPKGYDLFRVFYGGGDPAIAELAEEELVQIARAELKELLGIAAQPVHAEVFRWIDTSPKAEVGHLELVELILAQLPAGLYLAGSSYHGMTVSDCIRQGYDTAEFCLQYVETL